MIEHILPPGASTTERDVFSLRRVAISIQDRMGANRAPLGDMRQCRALELSIDSASQTGDPSRLPDSWPFELERLEGPIVARPVPVVQPRQTSFRYFLDGSQVTLPVWRVGLVPVVFSLASAGVLERSVDGEPSLIGDLLDTERTWILPLQADDADLADLIAELDRSGDAGLVDPLVDDRGVPFPDYAGLVGHYGFLLANAQTAANRIRSRLESRILNDWHLSHADDDGWIVVDGRLGDNVPRAVGLVKNLQTQHLVGAEALALFNMPVGYRTTAFRYVQRDQDGSGTSAAQGRTVWYLRFWDGQGKDAQHSLVRVEVEHDIDTTAQIDEISSWLLAERLPRAVADERWPTLLYPIHLLETMLKRTMNRYTTGWPS